VPGNSEVVERLNRAFQSSDEEGMLSCLDPDVELLPIRAQLEGTSYRGHEGFLQMVADLTTDWDGIRIDYTDLRESGDQVVAVSRLSAQGKASGVALDVPLAFVFDFRDGVAVRVQSFTDTAEAFAVAGIDA
jgi:ketosteroid isomerase-like protein